MTTGVKELNILNSMPQEVSKGKSQNRREIFSLAYPNGSNRSGGGKMISRLKENFM
jgi:hypothetical protein